MMEAPNLTAVLQEWASRTPYGVAMRHKRFGIWQTITWKDLNDKLFNFASGLVSLGMEPGNNLSVIGDNAPEWVIAEFAAMRLGGSCNGIYQEMQEEEVTYLVNSSESRVVVAEDQEQVDKLVAIWERINGNVIKIIVWDDRGMSHYFNQYPYLIRMEEVVELGKNDLKAVQLVHGIDVSPDTTALMLPTSGTTGLPKLCMISHSNLLCAAKAYQEVHPLYEWDELFALLPLAWVGEQLTVVRFVCNGAFYNFPEGKESLSADFREIQPTVSIMSPRMLEDICSDIRARMNDASFLKRKVYEFSLGLGMERADSLLEGKKVRSLLKRLLYSFFMFTTLRGLRQRVGLGRIRLAFTGGAAIGREVFTFYMATGINLLQLYGMTENCAAGTAHCSDDIRPETVGKPLPQIEVRVGEDGMIYIKSPTNIKGYYKNPENTAATFQDGWLATGDSGYFDELGHLVVLDRQKDLMHLKDGTRFAPQELENRLKFSPYIREAVVFGNHMDFIATMISIDTNNVANWANKRGIAYTTMMDLSQNQRIIELIRGELRKINDRLPPKIRFQKFVLLPKELHPDDEELTRTRKLKRNIIDERYKLLIEALYGIEQTHDLNITIKYMDGKISQLKSQVRLEDV